MVFNIYGIPDLVETELCSLISKEIDYTCKLEVLKNSLAECHDYNSFTGFKAIEKFNNSGVIDMGNLSYFFNQN